MSQAEFRLVNQGQEKVWHLQPLKGLCTRLEKSTG
jgi:hypothetical protein